MRTMETMTATASELERRGFEPQLFVNDAGTVLYRVASTGEFIDPLNDDRYYADDQTEQQRRARP